MFELGYRKLHTYMTLLSIGVISFWLMIVVFIAGVALGVEKLLVNPIFYIPFFIWFGFVSVAFTLCLFIKCHHCDKRLAVITKSNHQPKNQGWVLWFLRDLPPQIKCEHCGVLYQGTPNTYEP
ncbi:hypothetical protein ATW7_12633 [Alteromonadales bacterium TW-7]|nr:hypothetical protein ATW7_12633 [Alteromonadales bacterium TW-7]